MKRATFAAVSIAIGVCAGLWLSNISFAPAAKKVKYTTYKIATRDLRALGSNFVSCYLNSEKERTLFSVKSILKPNIRTQTPADFSRILSEFDKPAEIDDGAGNPIYHVSLVHIQRLLDYGDPRGYYTLRARLNARDVEYDIEAYRHDNSRIVPPSPRPDFLNFKPCPPASAGYPYQIR